MSDTTPKAKRIKSQTYTPTTPISREAVRGRIRSHISATPVISRFDVPRPCARTTLSGSPSPDVGPTWH